MKPGAQSVEAGGVAATLTGGLCIGLTLSIAEWNVAWWTSRADVLAVMLVPVAVAGYNWWLWFALRRRDRHEGTR